MKAFFLPIGKGRRFCVYHATGATPRSALLHVHPFAEEMNLSRRIAALQARSLAVSGHAVLQMDLHGCGDSDGDFGDADWQTWIRDVVEAADWLRVQTGLEVALWGVRAGCLLAAEAARSMRVPPHRFLFWQPVLSGEAYWRQFMRLRLAGDVIAERYEEGGSRRRPDEDRPLEVAGYAISPQMATGLKAARLDLPDAGGEAFCVEIGSEGERLSPALAAGVEAWRQAGWHVRSAVVSGSPFWQLPEADDCEALLGATAILLNGSTS